MKGEDGSTKAWAPIGSGCKPLGKPLCYLGQITHFAGLISAIINECSTWQTFPEQ